MFAAMLAAAGCIISQDELADRTCLSDADCPEAYACTGPEGLRFCEVIYPPPGSTVDGGTPDAGGVTPTYCANVQPILEATCVSSCHGAVTTGSGRTDFRLDYYEAEAGQPRGAKDMAARIKARAFDLRTMPPPGSTAPSDAERAVLGRWAAAGAPFCDGGTP
ncbi:hypothetical protein [Hyalangium sp.]|uniref:hypothetical protein n=1 Tax=Hyalangium sp. TaxID=2028555 RepID=UPI002D2395C1|nr:hypothetical protein [Hyalangium sp.]HYH95229.1 hypothetical protein [Hyalangium sp.]